MEQKISSHKFSKSEAIRFAWELTKKHFWFFVGFLLLAQVIGFLISSISQPLMQNSNVSIKIAGILVFLAGWIINLEIGFATVMIFFKIADKKKTAVKELFSYFDAGLIFRYFLISLILNLVTLVGFLLFIIPGIYFCLKYWFAPYIFVDKRTGVLEAFRESAKLTQGIKWQLFLLGLVQMLILIAGTLALIVGLFAAAPINFLSDIYVYRKISAQK